MRYDHLRNRRKGCLSRRALDLDDRVEGRVTDLLGVLGGLYIWQAPLKEVTGHSARPQEVGDGRSQAVKDGAHKAGYVQPFL